MATFIDYAVPAASSSVAQYSAVQLTSGETVKATTAVGQDRFHGIMQNDPTSTAHNGVIRFIGPSLCRPTSRAVTVGAILTCAANGMVQSATGSTKEATIGFALEAVAASTTRNGAAHGEYIRCMLTGSAGQ